MNPVIIHKQTKSEARSLVTQKIVFRKPYSAIKKSGVIVYETAMQWYCFYVKNI
jgi:hypothetical protein